MEGDTVEELLKEKDLSLETTVAKCCAQEAARKQRVEIAGSTSNANFVRQQRANCTQENLPISHHCCPRHVQDVDFTSTLGGARVVLHTDGYVTHAKKWDIWREFVGLGAERD